MRVSAVDENKGVIKDGAPFYFMPFLTDFGQCLAQKNIYGHKYMPTCKIQETKMSMLHIAVVIIALSLFKKKPIFP